jgi:hypothetical protein
MEAGRLLQNMVTDGTFAVSTQ